MCYTGFCKSVQVNVKQYFWFHSLFKKKKLNLVAFCAFVINECDGHPIFEKERIGIKCVNRNG